MTKCPFLFRKAKKKSKEKEKKNVKNNPRSHAPLCPCTSCVVKSCPHSLPIHGISTPVCVCVYVEGCITGKLGASMVEGIFNSCLTLIAIS